ncbi:MAG: hypothetical protein ACI8Y7_000505 [Candidatus Woesearchaeota archaeon]|jgi:hypothetical protein
MQKKVWLILFILLIPSVFAAQLPLSDLNIDVAILPLDLTAAETQVTCNVYFTNTIFDEYDPFLISKEYNWFLTRNKFEEAQIFGSSPIIEPPSSFSTGFSNILDCTNLPSGLPCAFNDQLSCGITIKNHLGETRTIESKTIGIKSSPVTLPSAQLLVERENGDGRMTQLTCEVASTDSFEIKYVWYKYDTAGDSFQELDKIPNTNVISLVTNNLNAIFQDEDIVKCEAYAHNTGLTDEPISNVVSDTITLDLNLAENKNAFVPFGVLEAEVVQVNNQRFWPKETYEIATRGVAEYVIDITCEGGSCGDVESSLQGAFGRQTEVIGLSANPNAEAYSLVSNPLTETEDYSYSEKIGYGLLLQNILQDTNAASNLNNKYEETVQNYQGTNTNCLSDITPSLFNPEKCEIALLVAINPTGNADTSQPLKIKHNLQSSTYPNLVTTAPIEALEVNVVDNSVDCKEYGTITDITLNQQTTQLGLNQNAYLEIKVHNNKSTIFRELSKHAAFYTSNNQIADFLDTENQNLLQVLTSNQATLDITVRFCGFTKTFPNVIQTLGTPETKPRLCYAYVDTIEETALRQFVRHELFTQFNDFEASTINLVVGDFQKAIVSLNEDDNIKPLNGNTDYKALIDLSPITNDGTREFVQHMVDKPGFTFTIINNLLVPRFSVCQEEPNDLCDGFGDGCSFNGICLSEGSFIRINLVNGEDRVVDYFTTTTNGTVGNKTLAVDYALSCVVNSPGTWAPSGSPPGPVTFNVCDNSFQQICSIDSDEYLSSEYHEGGTPNSVPTRFCVNQDNTQWEWYNASDLTTVTSNVPELCGATVLTPIDNNCNGAQVHPITAGVINYTTYLHTNTSGTFSFAVREDPDAFDSACDGSLTIETQHFDGRPFPNANISLLIRDGTNYQIFQRIVSDASGLASVPTVPATDYAIFADNTTDNTPTENFSLVYNDHTRRVILKFPKPNSVFLTESTSNIECPGGKELLIVERIAQYNGEPVKIKYAICK